MSKEDAVFISIRLLAMLACVIALPHLINAFIQLLFYGFGSSGEQRLMLMTMLVPLTIYPLVVGLLWCKAEKLAVLLLKK